MLLRLLPLFITALTPVGCSSYFGALYKDQRARGKKANTAIAIVARRMCQIAWHLLQEKRAYVADLAACQSLIELAAP